ncbi:MAG: hypothetical protein ACFCD0_21975 [Gemmataceae bacterium]
MKKFITIAVLLAVTSLVAEKATDGRISSYVRTFVQNCRDGCRKSTSPEYELDYIEKQLSQLDRMIDQKAGPAAKLHVEIEKQLRPAAKELQVQVQNERSEVLAALDDFETNGEKFLIINEVRYDNNDAREQLRQQVEGVKVLERRLAAKQDLLQAKEERYNLLRTEITELDRERDRLRADLEALRAEYETLKTEALKNRTSNSSAVTEKIQKLRKALEDTKQQFEEEKAKRRILRSLENRPGDDQGTGKADANTPISVQDLRQQLTGTQTQDITTSNKKSN